MANKIEIKKNIKFYKREMKKWELRITLSLIPIFLFTSIIFLLYLKAYDWDITNIHISLFEFPKLSIVTPLLFYLSLSVSQFNYYKKQLDLYKLKYTD